MNVKYNKNECEIEYEPYVEGNSLIFADLCRNHVQIQWNSLTKEISINKTLALRPS